MLFNWYFLNFAIGDILDILSVAIFFYIFILIIKESRIISMGLGIVVVILIWLLSDFLELNTLNWMFSNVIRLGVIALIIVFQPELRSALIRLGDFSFLDLFVDYSDEKIVHEIVGALEELAQKKMGAIIVFERKVGLMDEIEKGDLINSDITRKLLVSIFFKDNPLHDGAVIIKGDKIISAASILPVEDIPQGFSGSYYNFGLRHRAGMGITKETDAISIILSEETARLSVCQYGQLKPMSLAALREFILSNLFREKSKKSKIKKNN